MDIKWYVIYTKPDSEKRVTDIFTRKKIENYSPYITVCSSKSDDKKGKNIPLFKNYVFVRTTEKQHQEIKKMNDVVNLVYWMGKPVTIKNSEIKVIKLFLSEYSNVTLEKKEIRLNIINTNDNNNMDLEAPMITIKNKKAYAGLPSLGYIMTAEVETPSVRIISVESTLKGGDLKKLNY